uniref:Ribosomal protein L16 n=1 Tax=Pyramimonas parkeae TaxID=36894 RepID=A0A1S5R1U3_9CHLO|nr:ribosomal protein L16 [Pyramimonas parkeae]
MLLQPKRMKYRKYQKNIQNKKKDNTYELAFGEYGIKAITNGYLPARTLEATKQVLNKKLKKAGKLWICVFPNIPRTEKPAEVRMGKGKGAVSFWVAQIPAGQILFELNTNTPELASQVQKIVNKMVNIPVRLIKREEAL